MTGNAVFQIDVSPKLIGFRLSKKFDVNPSISATDRGGESNENHFKQIVIVDKFDAWVRNIFKTVLNKCSRTFHEIVLRGRNQPFTINDLTAADSTQS